MNLVEHTKPHLFELEDNPWLIRALFLMVGIGGFLMWIVIMNQYGATSWYRSSYQIGLLSTVVGLILFLFFGRRSHFRLHLETRQINLRYWKGVFLSLNERFPAAEILDIRMDKKTHPRLGEQFRLSVLRKDAWLPLSPRFSSDRYAVERSGQLLLAQLSPASH